VKNYVVKAGIGVAVFLFSLHWKYTNLHKVSRIKGKKAEEEKAISLKSSSETFSKRVE
jgi:hypothetical protein